MTDTDHCAGPLTMRDRQAFDQYEATIDKGLGGFIKVGTAFLRIRDDRLYRETHATFEAYTLERFSLTARHVNRLIGAAEVVLRVSGGDGTNLVPLPPPANEAQARALGGAPPESQAGVWEEANRQAGAAGEKKPSARRIEEIAAKARAGLPFRQPEPPQPKPGQKATRAQVEAEERRLREEDARERRDDALADTTRALARARKFARALEPAERERLDAWLSPAAAYLASLD